MEEPSHALQTVPSILPSVISAGMELRTALKNVMQMILDPVHARPKVMMAVAFLVPIRAQSQLMHVTDAEIEA